MPPPWASHSTPQKSPVGSNYNQLVPWVLINTRDTVSVGNATNASYRRPESSHCARTVGHTNRLEGQPGHQRDVRSFLCVARRWEVYRYVRHLLRRVRWRNTLWPHKGTSSRSRQVYVFGHSVLGRIRVVSPQHVRPWAADPVAAHNSTRVHAPPDHGVARPGVRTDPGSAGLRARARCGVEVPLTCRHTCHPGDRAH